MLFIPQLCLASYYIDVWWESKPKQIGDEIYGRQEYYGIVWLN